MITRNDVYALGVGHHRCLQCDAPERSMSVWVSGSEILAKCHRASCGAFAKYPYMAAYLEYEAVERLVESPQLLPYQGNRESPPYPILKGFIDKFGFDPYGSWGILILPLQWNPDKKTVLLPIRSPSGVERGVLERTAWGVRPKSCRIWKAKHEPMISWTSVNCDNGDPIVIVEDQVSAAKYYDAMSNRAVALCGTNLTADAVAEIQQVTHDIIIALDPDATTKAFSMARRWGAAFYSCRVQVLTKDIKDMTHTEIVRMFKHD